MSFMMRLRNTVVFVLLAVVAAVAVARQRSVSGASAPSTIARGLPGGAVAYLEAEKLKRALELWQSSTLRKHWDDGAADEEMRRGMLFLRLAERLGALEGIAGFELTLPRLMLLAGDRAGLAIYDLGNTTFVFEAQLASAEIAKLPLLEAKRRFAARKYAGVGYFVKQLTEGSEPAELAFAIVGRRLVVSNDVTQFHAALLLAAREERVATDGTAAGKSLADDADFTALMAAAPRDAVVRVFVRLGAIKGTHHFDDFWIFGGDSGALEGISASLLTLTPGDGGLTETRVHAYEAGATPPDAPTMAKIGELDLAAVVARLPDGAMHVSVEETAGGTVAARIGRLLPSLDLDDGEPEERAPLFANGRAGELLTAAGASRLIELVVLDSDSGRGGARPGMPAVRRGGAMAIRLDAPDRLDQAVLERAVVDYLRAIATVDGAGAGVPIAFTDAGGGLRSVSLPLVDRWALTMARVDDGRILIVATDAALAGRLVADLARADGPAPLLEADGALVSRLDLAAAGGHWKHLAAVLAERENWSDTDNVRWVASVVPSLFAAVADAATVTTVGYRVGAYYVEQVSYR